jgi:hypothetical protein
VGAVFLEDAQAMVVESQYDDVDRAAHRPAPALKADQRDVSRIALCMTLACVGSGIYRHVEKRTWQIVCLNCNTGLPTEISSGFTFWGWINDRQENRGYPMAMLPHVLLEFEKKSALTSIVSGECRGIPS